MLRHAFCYLSAMKMWLVLLMICPGLLRAQVKLIDAQQMTLKVNRYIVPGAERGDLYLPLLSGKRIGVVANHTSMVGSKHLVDALTDANVNVKAVFAPEHGFRGEAGAGEQIVDGRDALTNLPVRSLYGKTKKPTPEMLADIEMLLFDMQDVGARFYTYLSTLHFVMEAAAELGIPVVVLDRPNPNGFYTDGPVLDLKFQSFVGMHPIPLVHGMTLGELALMINGEGWLKDGVQCDLEVVKCHNYKRNDLYELSVDPSPNLMSMEAVYLYPSLCLFEPTIISIGRGTHRAFEVFGHPDMQLGSFEFTPKSIQGKSSNPKHKDRLCYGVDLKAFGGFYFKTHQQLYLNWLVDSHRYTKEKLKVAFFTNPEFFDKLAGTDELRRQIESGLSAEEIRATWHEALEAFKKQRKPYLIYG